MSTCKPQTARLRRDASGFNLSVKGFPVALSIGFLSHTTFPQILSSHIYTRTLTVFFGLNQTPVGSPALAACTEATIMHTMIASNIITLVMMSLIERASEPEGFRIRYSSQHTNLCAFRQCQKFIFAKNRHAKRPRLVELGASFKAGHDV